MIDLEKCLKELPAHFRQLAEQMKHASIAEIADKIDTPPSTLRDRVRKLRKHFERTDLKKYL